MLVLDFLDELLPSLLETLNETREREPGLRMTPTCPGSGRKPSPSVPMLVSMRRKGIKVF